MSDVKRVTLTTISDVVKKGGTSPFGALSSAFESSTAAAIHPFGSSKGGESTSSGPNAGSGGGGGGATAAKKLKTVRLELNLFEPTADSFPEFNFSKLIHVEQKRLKKAQKKQQHDDEANGFLSDPELDNDVARMARELERKYGSGSDYATKGKAARPSKLDYYDRGAGYDEEDSFIDNSEAYDELIPQEIETVGGGFYINSGQLEFKQLSNFERPEDAHRMPKPKKRALSTTSESSDEDEPAGEKKNAPVAESSASGLPGQSKQTVEKLAATAGALEPGRTQPEGVEKGSDAGKSGPEPEDKARTNGHVAKKQKIVDNGQVAVEQKNKPSASEGGGGGKEKANGVKEKVAVAPGGVSSTVGGEEASKKDESGMKSIKTTTVKDMLRAKRDSLRKMEQEKKGRSSGSSRVSSSEAEEDGDGGGDDEDEDEENDEEDDEDDEEDEEEDDEYDEEGSEKNSPESGSEVDIASESESSHGSEKDAMAGKSGEPLPVANGALDGEPAKERKQKDRKLPEDIPDQLRRDVDSLKELARGLSGAGGKLNLFESKVADLLLRIDDGARASGSSTRNAVFRHLEAQLSVSRQSLKLKLKKIRIRKLEGRTKSLASKLEDVIADTMPAIVTKYELDCLKVNELRLAAAAQTVTSNPLPNGEKGDAPPNPVAQQIRNPKKKYTWNERSRDLLWELYNVRQQLFALVRPRNQSEDEVLAEFLRTKVVPLWPKGWIRYEDIQKELDRRKKALAKGQAAAAGGAPLPTGKKSTPVVSPLVSPSTTPFESAALPLPTGSTPNGVKAHEAACLPRSSTPVKPSGTGKGGVDGDKSAATATHHSLSAAANMSPNAAHKRTSDHSIINIMNSPPPPPAADKQSAGDQRRSFDAMDTSGAPFANPDTGGTVGRDSLKRSPATPADRRNQDRQRWNSREDDSDSSIEIIAEYNVPRAPVGVGGGAFQAGKLPASATVLQMTTPTLPGASNLPVLNKEKYKNLIAAKHKSSSHGGSGSSAGSSPIGMGGGVIGFAAPSGNVSGGGGGGGMHLPDMAGGTGAGSVRLKDTPSPIDVDVHQIMKDLKELQELQKQHNTSGNRKPDSSALQSQQQHAATATPTTTSNAAARSATVADYFIDCDMDEEDILFATNFTYGGGAHKN
ncbi:yemanuclein isoform X1 [Anopheles arabiensis]|uniref:yemanuclein isoform X1 n=1 Tax=Anopheles arabiensis TaxID=7173 RepID=UPI001AAC662C|nr:yemanuclein isoform X1 [Anopheles arabiensis]